MNEKIIEISDKNISLLKDFIMNMGSSKKTFRYFEKRGLDCLDNHLLSCLLLKEEKPIAYGHLDKDGDNIWLGVCVIEGQIGYGYGKKMMSHLTNFAKDSNLKNIQLSVDKENQNAIKMYYNFGFWKKEEAKNYYLMELNVEKFFTKINKEQTNG